MNNTRKLLVISVILAMALVAAFAALNLSIDGNALIASNFVKNEATYKFDGIPETFKLTGTTSIKCPLCREFQFEYQSRNSGYGDRTGAVVATVITDHKAKVVVEGETISSAILDDIWDMKAQRLIESRNSPGEAGDETVR
jgi:hypothetical protein